MSDDNGSLVHLRRQFFRNCLLRLGSIALLSLENAQRGGAAPAATTGADQSPQAAPRAKRIIFLFMAGGPSHLDLFDDKPLLRQLDDQPPPASFTTGLRFAFTKADARLLGSRCRFGRHGKSGGSFSELLPWTASVADEITLVRSMTHDVFNHGPAQLYLGSSGRQPGRPSMGSWVLYGLGSESRELPGFVVLQSGLGGPDAGQHLYSNGFLSPEYQGVRLSSSGPPVLYADMPPGVDRRRQAETVQAISDLNALHHHDTGDDTIQARTRAYELAFRMQAAAPELMDLRGETKETLQLYGAELARPSFARNCLLARRLVERGVRFVQLIHKDWDHHGNAGLTLEEGLPLVCRETDQPSAALVRDLHRRGLLEDTLVIWAGEFGRTPMGEKRYFMGRDHHPYAFSIWMAGGGIKAGYVHGQTDELGLQVIEKPVSVQDFQATVLHLLGLDHEQLTYRFQGRDFRLTDVSGEVQTELLA